MWKDLIVDGVNDGPERVEVYVSWNPKKLIKGRKGFFLWGKRKANEEGREQLKAKMSRIIEGRGRDMQGLGLLTDS